MVGSRVRRDAPVATWERVHGELPGTPGEYDRRMRARKIVRARKIGEYDARLKTPPPRTPPARTSVIQPTKRTAYPMGHTGVKSPGGNERRPYHEYRAAARAAHRAEAVVELKVAAAAAAKSGVEEERLRQRALDRLMVEVQHKLHQKRGQVDAGFRLLDADGSGAIDASEFEHGLQQLLNRPLAPSEAEAVFERLDSDRNGMVELTEFSRLVVDGSLAATGGHGFQRHTARPPKPAAAGGAPRGTERPQSAPASFIGVQPDFMSARRQGVNEAWMQRLTPAAARAAEMVAGESMKLVLQPPAVPPRPAQPPTPGTAAGRAFAMRRTGPALSAPAYSTAEPATASLSSPLGKPRPARDGSVLRQHWATTAGRVAAREAAADEMAAAIVAAKRQRYGQYEGAIRRREFFACGFHGAHMGGAVESTQPSPPTVELAGAQQPAPAPPRRDDWGPPTVSRGRYAYVATLPTNQPTPRRPSLYSYEAG